MIHSSHGPRIVALQLAIAFGIALNANAEKGSPEKNENEFKRQWGKPVVGQAISIATKKPVYAPEEAIVLDVLFKVVGKQGVHAIGGNCLDNLMYRLSVSGPDGTSTPLSSYGRKILDCASEGSMQSLELQPGHESHLQFTLSRLFDLTLPGEYTVVVRRKVVTGESQRPTAEATSNKIEITIEQGGPACWIVKPDEEKPAPRRNGR